MPIYEYRCAACKKKFELLRPMSQANTPAECPKCKGQGERLMSGFMAKGSGVGGGSCSSPSCGGGCSGCH